MRRDRAWKKIGDLWYKIAREHSIPNKGKPDSDGTYLTVVHLENSKRETLGVAIVQYDKGNMTRGRRVTKIMKFEELLRLLQGVDFGITLYKTWGRDK